MLPDNYAYKPEESADLTMLVASGLKSYLQKMM